MTEFYKYTELVTLDKRPEILAVKEVVATEKLHGSNFRVRFPESMAGLDEVQFGARNEEFGPGDDGFYGGRPVQWFRRRPELLTALWQEFQARNFGDVVVYGEVCGAGIQKGVRYVPGDDILFRAFDIRISGNFVTYDLFVEICDKVGLPRTPEVWRGEPTLAAFDALLEKPSAEGQRNGVENDRNLAEGVVIRSVPLLRNVFGEWLIIKHKSERFEEVAREKIRADRPDMTPVAAFAEMFVTPGRVVNVVGHLRDASANLVNDMADMPILVPALLTDLHKECEPEWQILTAQGFDDKQIRGAVTKTLANVYRRVLIDQALGETR